MRGKQRKLEQDTQHWQASNDIKFMFAPGLPKGHHDNIRPGNAVRCISHNWPISVENTFQKKKTRATARNLAIKIPEQKE